LSILADHPSFLPFKFFVWITQNFSVFPVDYLSVLPYTERAEKSFDTRHADKEEKR